LCPSSTHPGIALAQDRIPVLLCTPNQFVGQGRHRHQLANYSLSGARHYFDIEQVDCKVAACLSGARHYFDIEQVDCKVAASFARRHEGNVWVHFGSCPNGRHTMELNSRDVSVIVVGEIGL
jgi:hypothetical protein